MKTFKKLTALALATVPFMMSSVSYANDLANKSWAEIEAQAKKEGNVTVSIWYLQPQFRTFVKQFEDQYGIKVRIPEGTVDGNINKLFAEKNQAKGKMDVIALGAENLHNVFKNEVVADISFFPDFEKRNHKLQGVDLGKFAVGFWGNQTGFAYDPLKISEEKLPQSWADVEAYLKANPKKFGYSDPNGGSSGTAFIQRTIINVVGDYNYQTQEVDRDQVTKWATAWQWFRDNNGNLTRTASNADSLTRLNDGELDIVSAWQDHLFSLQKQGAITGRLKFYVPKFGMPAGGNAMVIAKNAPNPAASLLFVHWISSPEIQAKLSESFGVRPLDNASGGDDVVFFVRPSTKAIVEAFTKEVVSK